jgi:peroxiredoxin Q/BCP
VEATEFRDRIPEFAQLGVAVYGMSPDDLDSHRAFSEKHRLNMPLLSDAGHRVIEQWGFYGERERDGKKFMAVLRSTVMVGPDGRVERLWENVQFQGHAAEVLTEARALSS